MVENTENSNNESSGIIATVVNENRDRNYYYSLLLDALNDRKTTNKLNLAQSLDRALARIADMADKP